MATGAQDEPFLDDDLDHLPMATFEALENGISRQASPWAATVTQQNMAAEQSAYSCSPRKETRPQIISRLTGHGPMIGHEKSSDYGSDDDDIIDLNAQSMLIDCTLQESQAKWNRQGDALSIDASVQHGDRIMFPWHSTSDTSRQGRKITMNLSAHQTSKLNEVEEDLKLGLPSLKTGEGGKVDKLMAQIRQLEMERDDLQGAIKSATTNVQAKAGEIAIVRSNYDKITKDYERRLADMQKQHIQDIAKERAGLEAARRDREKVETNNKFLEHDLELAQRAEKSRSLKKVMNESAENGADFYLRKGLSTPRKAKQPPYRDGFNDDEASFVSPSRSRDRSESITPTSGAKRKRQASDRSPIQPLTLSQSERQSPRRMQNPPQLPEIVMVEKKDPRFSVAQLILNHRAQTRKRRTIEVFGDYYLPSRAGVALSGQLYEILTQHSTDFNQSRFIIKFCNSLCGIWKKCLIEQYYDPLHDLVDWLHFSILSAPLDVPVHIYQDIIPLCVATIDVIAVPVAKAFSARTIFEPPLNSLGRFIDPTKYLELLLLICERCSTNPETLAQFWTSMEFDFVLLILHRAQPLQQVKGMLRLLCHSVLPTSFGALAVSGPDSTQQRKSESDVLDRLTSLLFENPDDSVAKFKLRHKQSARTATEPQPTRLGTSISQEIFSIRVLVVRFLLSLCFTPHGGNAIAIHPLVTGRLVRFLHENVAALHAHRTATLTMTATLVNATIKILAHLTACHASALELRTRLTAIPGGPQKHLVALARVAFADGMAGVDAEVIEAAHRILDEYLSPEEGEAVVEVFSTAPLRAQASDG